MNFTANTPEGTRDILYGECNKRRRLQSRLTKLFRSRGYAEVSTPTVEFYDTFQKAGTMLSQEDLLKIIDRSGRICVIRPDCTVQIARIAATKLQSSPLPQRLYYNEEIFRSREENAGVSTEVPQCGIELIGAPGEKADLEMIATAVDALRASGAEQFHIELGHINLFRDLVRRMGLDSEKTEEVRLLIEGKKFAALNDLLDEYQDRSGCEALKMLSRLFGGPEVLDEAEKLAGPNESIRYLRDLYGYLCQAGYGEAIQFDLGTVTQIDYYTGVVFRGYVKGAGSAVLSGGRYDKLVEAYGRKAEATGFAIDVDALADCLEDPPFQKTETVIHYDKDRIARAIEIQKECTTGSCELSPFDTIKESREMAERKGAHTLIILDADGERREVL